MFYNDKYLISNIFIILSLQARALAHALVLAQDLDHGRILAQYRDRNHGLAVVHGLAEAKVVRKYFQKHFANLEF